MATTERMGMDPLDVMKRAARRYAVGSRAGQEMRDAIAAVSAMVKAAAEVRDAAWGPGSKITPRIARLDAALAPFSEAGR